jgi:hypothetical protein
MAFKQHISKGLHWCILCAGCLLAGSCKKFVDIEPPKSEAPANTSVYTNDAGATAVILGIYGRMINSSGFAGGYNRSVTFLAALSADELINYSAAGVPRQFYQNAVSANNPAIQDDLWNEIYTYIYAANDVYEGVKGSAGITQPVKAQLMGEALFVRAFCHFYLVNLFGAVPLVTRKDYEQNMKVKRTAPDTLYRQIIGDLQDAQSLLGNNYAGGEKVRPGKAAATALLARVFLYRQDWANAGEQASRVINDPAYRLNDTLHNVFLKNSTEAIWQLMPNTPALNTWEGFNFILTAAPAVTETSAAALSPWLLQAFESGDRRRSSWVDSIKVNAAVYYFPCKYRVKRGDVLTEYSMVLRLAEQYLVRAEARAHLGNFSGACADVNVIRRRAGLPPVNYNTAAALLAAVEHERQVELFTEWGHRWLDLKRTGRANAVLAQVKPAWQGEAALYPLPLGELAKNAFLQPQNPGY